MSYAANDQYEEAKIEWNKAIETSDDSVIIASTHLLLGGLYYQEQNIDLSVEHCKKGLDSKSGIENQTNRAVQETITVCKGIIQKYDN